MRTVYEPKGRAREYSPLAVNFYKGCDHGCVYCYGPGIQRSSREDYLNVTPREGLLEALEKDAKKWAGTDKQVLFNFMGDPYCKANDTHRIAREALKIMLKHRIPVSVLTKGGSRVLQDLDIIKQFENSIMVGATLTTLDPEISQEWEPGAADPTDRLDALYKLKIRGIRTWASFEPVIDVNHALSTMVHSLPCVDTYKVGKMNNHRTLTGNDDWTWFLREAVRILRGAGKQFYIKEDLRIAAPSVPLKGDEIIADAHCAKPFGRG